MTTHRIPALDLSGRPRQSFQIKINENNPDQLFISGPKFALLDTTAVVELANLLADLLEQLPEEEHHG